jgi:exodeoxyribonuclease VII small subunit
MAQRSGAAPPAREAEDLPFEASLEKLESIVDRLEAGDVELEAALAAFEEGVRLARRCAAQLEQAERRVEILVQEGREIVARPFDAETEE